MNLKLTDLARLDVQASQGILLSLSSQYWGMSAWNQTQVPLHAQQVLSLSNELSSQSLEMLLFFHQVHQV